MNLADRSFDWNHVRAFLAAADEGSFSGAARALRTAQPTVGRQIAALEGELGVSLFERVGRGIALTPTGLALVEHVRTMADAALRVSRVAAGQALSIDGPIRITASELVASHHLPGPIARLRRLHPGLEVEIVASNEAQDLRRREADVAIRSFRPTEPDLVARKIRDGEAYLYAARAYAAELGPALDAATIARATFIGFDHGARFRDGLSSLLGVDVPAERFALVAASQHVQWALVREGAGIGVMMAEIGDADRSVVRVFADRGAIPVPMWLVTHRDVHTSRRVRAVADFLCAALSPPRHRRDATDARARSLQENEANGAKRGARRRRASGS